MGDRMRQIPFGQLMTWALSEYESEGSVFGVSKLYTYDVSSGSHYDIFGKKLELPLGPAAGPHTQMAQNIVAAYASGARFFELKTVQTLDGKDLPVSKPCIYVPDEGYNVEWSTELYVPQALDEYIKGWFAARLLSREFALGSDDGFVFNMSVGYDLEGIQSVKIDSFIEGLKNAQDTDYWKTCMQWSYENLMRFRYVDKHMLDNMQPEISNSITLSTLHGCPPQEIERIAAYLLSEKKLHTFVKCNPTLVGFEFARETLDSLGYDYLSFDDRHFKNDLQFEDAVPMLRRLQSLADSLGLEFGVKLTNTFPVQIKENELPGEEMYMSGRALFPLSMEVAKRLSDAFDGKLRISYCGGADAQNIADILGAGMYPVTLATTLLKPGGYERLHQIASMISDTGKKAHSCGKTVSKNALRPSQNRKLEEKLPLLDCYMAPCRGGCPFGQDVPAYLRLVSEGKHLEALRVITERNPLPHITGTICSHNCMNKCTRHYYEVSIDIRKAKLEAAQSAYEQLLTEIKNSPKNPKTGKCVAVVGGGPAGLASAYFLAHSGCSVIIFEERDLLGGVVRYAIPSFRIDDEAIDKDIALVMAAGVEVRTSTRITDIDKLRSEGFDEVVIATGAWKASSLKLEEGSAVDALAFLEELKRSPDKMSLGENVVVIGGGNTAMDTVRAAIRAKGVKNVTLAYRRTRRYMPADAEEIELALSDGVRFLELVSPVGLKEKTLICDVLTLGESDLSGRPSSVKTGETVAIACDTLVSATGNKVDGNLYDGQSARVLGDAKRGPATIAEAIADAMSCARDIAGAGFEKYERLNVNPSSAKAHYKRGKLCTNSDEAGEAKYCLECPTVCEICTEVCPNRANIVIEAGGRPQIVHIDFMCNECGNCGLFCPYTGAPYKDKFTYFIYEQDFEESENPGFIALEDGSIRVRLDGEISEHRDGTNLPPDIWLLIEACIKKFDYWFDW